MGIETIDMNPLAGSPSILDRARLFGDVVAENNLYLLRAVDGTVNSLEGVCDYSRASAREAERLRRIIIECSDVGEIDPDDTVEQKLTSALDQSEKLLRILKSRRDVALKTSDLKHGDYRRMVVEAYDGAIDCTRTLFEAISELRTTMMEHDADKSPSAGRFTNVRSLMKAARG